MDTTDRPQDSLLIDAPWRQPHPVRPYNGTRVGPMTAALEIGLSHASLAPAVESWIADLATAGHPQAGGWAGIETMDLSELRHFVQLLSSQADAGLGTRLGVDVDRICEAQEMVAFLVECDEAVAAGGLADLAAQQVEVARQIGLESPLSAEALEAAMRAWLLALSPPVSGEVADLQADILVRFTRGLLRIEAGMAWWELLFNRLNIFCVSVSGTALHPLRDVLPLLQAAIPRFPLLRAVVAEDDDPLLALAVLHAATGRLSSDALARALEPRRLAAMAIRPREREVRSAVSGQFERYELDVLDEAIAHVENVTTAMTRLERCLQEVSQPWMEGVDELTAGLVGGDAADRVDQHMTALLELAMVAAVSRESPIARRSAFRALLCVEMQPDAANDLWRRHRRFTALLRSDRLADEDSTGTMQLLAPTLVELDELVEDLRSVVEAWSALDRTFDCRMVWIALRNWLLHGVIDAPERAAPEMIQLFGDVTANVGRERLASVRDKAWLPAPAATVLRGIARRLNSRLPAYRMATRLKLIADEAASNTFDALPAYGRKAGPLGRASCRHDTLALLLRVSQLAYRDDDCSEELGEWWSQNVGTYLHARPPGLFEAHARGVRDAMVPVLGTEAAKWGGSLIAGVYGEYMGARLTQAAETEVSDVELHVRGGGPPVPGGVPFPEVLTRVASQLAATGNVERAWACETLTEHDLAQIQEALPGLADPIAVADWDALLRVGLRVVAGQSSENMLLRERRIILTGPDPRFDELLRGEAHSFAEDPDEERRWRRAMAGLLAVASAAEHREVHVRTLFLSVDPFLNSLDAAKWKGYMEPIGSLCEELCPELEMGAVLDVAHATLVCRDAALSGTVTWRGAALLYAPDLFGTPSEEARWAAAFDGELEVLVPRSGMMGWLGSQTTRTTTPEESAAVQRAVWGLATALERGTGIRRPDGLAPELLAGLVTVLEQAPGRLSSVGAVLESAA